VKDGREREPYGAEWWGRKRTRVERKSRVNDRVLGNSPFPRLSASQCEPAALFFQELWVLSSPGPAAYFQPFFFFFFFFFYFLIVFFKVCSFKFKNFFFKKLQLTYKIVHFLKMRYLRAI